jgi:hypothetical protein
MTKRRIGQFYVAKEVFEAEWFAEVLICLRFVPYRVEYHYDKAAMHMVGVSEMFAESEEGFTAPEYALEITRGEYGKLTVDAIALNL